MDDAAGDSILAEVRGGRWLRGRVDPSRTCGNTSGTGRTASSCTRAASPARPPRRPRSRSGVGPSPRRGRCPGLRRLAGPGPWPRTPPSSRQNGPPLPGSDPYRRCRKRSATWPSVPPGASGSPRAGREVLIRVGAVVRVRRWDATAANNPDTPSVAGFRCLSSGIPLPIPPKSHHPTAGKSRPRVCNFFLDFVPMPAQNPALSGREISARALSNSSPAVRTA